MEGGYQDFLVKIGGPVLYPAIFVGCQFFDERSEEKNSSAAGESGGHYKPYPVGSRDKTSENFGYSAC